VDGSIVHHFLRMPGIMEYRPDFKWTGFDSLFFKNALSDLDGINCLYNIRTIIK